MLDRDRLRYRRYQIGAWLLRPYLRALWEHYDGAAAQKRAAGKSKEASNCEYIQLGLQYANKPTIWRANGG